MTNFEKQLTKVLEQAATKLNLTQYAINLDLNAVKGDGFLGEFYKVSITDKETEKTHHLAVKKAPSEKIRREQMSIELVYKNEIWFYSEIAPALRRFELDHQVPEPFDSIPEYLVSNGDVGEEIIVFQDITKLGYLLREKDLLLDDEHATHIFKTYGHFHAISFCLKEEKPEEFARLIKPLHNIWKAFSDNENFTDSWKLTIEEAQKSLDPVSHGAVLEKFQKYVDDFQNVFNESQCYRGQHFGILHGDCWSNNMMFKYKDSLDSRLEGMNLLDFQLVASSSPVFDLSYFFYTGGSKQLFDKLEHYLDVYYQGFSEAARALDGDPQKLLPREILSRDWKQYSKFGMILSLMLTKVKLISKADSVKLIEAVDNQTEENQKPIGLDGIKYDAELFASRVRDILVHVHEIDAL